MKWLIHEKVYNFVLLTEFAFNSLFIVFSDTFVLLWYFYKLGPFYKVPFFVCFSDRTNIGEYLCSLTQRNDVKIQKPRSVFLRGTVVLILTLILLEPKVISLWQQCRARSVCTSVQYDQALCCWLTNFNFSSWYP